MVTIDAAWLMCWRAACSWLLRFAPGRFRQEAEVSLCRQFLVLELLGRWRAQPAAAVCERPAGTPPDPEGAHGEQPSVHE